MGNAFENLVEKGNLDFLSAGRSLFTIYNYNCLVKGNDLLFHAGKKSYRSPRAITAIASWAIIVVFGRVRRTVSLLCLY